MIANIGAPARMTNETSHKYVANLRRVSDGPPNEGTHIAFVPEIDEVHDGVRVNVLSSRLNGADSVRQGGRRAEPSALVHHDQVHREASNPCPTEKRDEGVVKTSLIDRLRPDHDGLTAINGTFNVPEMLSSRIEGEWLIPSEGALLVSMGPSFRRDKGLRGGYQERLIAITASPTTDRRPPRPPPCDALTHALDQPLNAKGGSRFQRSSEFRMHQYLGLLRDVREHGGASRRGRCCARRARRSTR